MLKQELDAFKDDHSEQTIDTSKKVRIGIIGCGWIAGSHLTRYMQMVKEIVQSGVLGDIYYIQTGGGRRRGIPTPFGTTFIEKDKGAIGALGDIGCYSS